MNVKDTILSEKQAEANEHSLRHCKTTQYLMNPRFYKFKVGDVLNRLTSLGDDKWQVEEIHYGLPRRYVYAFENEAGVGFIERLNFNGEPDQETALYSVISNASTRYALDPEYESHLLLNTGEFDPTAAWREYESKLKKAFDINKSNVIDVSSIDIARNFINSLNVGGIFWKYYYSSYNDVDCYNTEYPFNSALLNFSKYQVIAKTVNKNTLTVEIQEEGESYTVNETERDLLGQYVSLSKPVGVGDLL